MNLNAATLIGQSVDRAEDRRFLTGTGKFVDDLSRAGMLHAVVLRSGIAHGRIRSLDAAAALAMPGVHAVIAAAEIGDDIPVIPLRLANLPEFKTYFQPVIAKDKVRYVGEPMAVVVAETQALAEDALEAIHVDIERLPAVPDRHADGERHVAAVRSKRQQPRGALCGVVRRCRQGLRQCRVHPPRELSLPPLDRIAARDPRPDRRMGCE
jgi:CO/xanthine dehydrogenase Mo-binding subunit